MFITVRYGDDQSLIFNINCRNEVLLHQIKKRCRIDRDDIIDLSDEQGVVKNLRQNLQEYGIEYLNERETLILLRVDTCVPDNQDEDSDNMSLSDKTIFIPMLTAMNDNQDFIASLNPKDNMSGKLLSTEEDVKGRKSKTKEKKKDKAKTSPVPPKRNDVTGEKFV